MPSPVSVRGGGGCAEYRVHFGGSRLAFLGRKAFQTGRFVNRRQRATGRPPDMPSVVWVLLCVSFYRGARVC